MITYLTRDHLDVEKYDRCISNAINSRIYARSWYLDAVTKDRWDVLVLDDYVAVMPLPKRRKFFLNYIYLSPWSQQLGVFSTGTIDSRLVKQFIAEKGRKSNVKQASNFNLRIVPNYNYSEIISFFRLNKGHEIPRKKSDYDVLNTLIANANSLDMVENVGVVNANFF